MASFASTACFLFFYCEAVFGYEYLIKTHPVPVDHFSFARNDTFKIRYLINDSYWDRNRGPIFFYTGNEGSIDMFANNTGFMWEIAPTFKALLVFAEHRYYGESLPFGNRSYSDPEHLGYLTSQQALADYVDLMTHLTRNLSQAHRIPVIAFGGSYGGMLAAYIRMKYPHVVDGAIAASAPIWQFEGMTPCDAFARITTSSFTAENSSCTESIRNSWSAINNITSKEDGLKWLSTEWHLCQPLKNASSVKNLKDWLADTYGTLAMLNYPYPTDFLAPLPGRPVSHFCSHLRNPKAKEKDLLRALFLGISVYFNHSGQAKCLNLGSSSDSDLGDQGWDFQSCTEMVMPMCQTGITDMFEPEEWDLTKFSEGCQKKWKVTPDSSLAERNYGGKRISTATNIVFSNGLLDPWAGGGVLKAPSTDVTVVLVPEGAHHLDLRAADPADPPSVRRCRQIHQENIKKWIKEHRGRHLPF